MCFQRMASALCGLCGGRGGTERNKYVQFSSGRYASSDHSGVRVLPVYCEYLLDVCDIPAVSISADLLIAQCTFMPPSSSSPYSFPASHSSFPCLVPVFHGAGLNPVCPPRPIVLPDYLPIFDFSTVHNTALHIRRHRCAHTFSHASSRC